jgi:hypothetical protein
MFMHNVTTCFTQKYELTWKLNGTLPNLTGKTAYTSDCITRSESHNNIDCTANNSVPLHH